MNRLANPSVRKGPTPHEIQEALATMEVAPEGISQKLTDAALSIAALAAFYVQYNKAKGFNDAIKDPRQRSRIQGRIANDVDQVATAMKQGAIIGYTEREKALFAPLVQVEALSKAGYDPRDIEEAGQIGLISLRKQIGVGVDTQARTKYIRSLRKTAAASIEK